ncbi:unnamed protein product, partial [Ixodes hexagonus]
VLEHDAAASAPEPPPAARGRPSPGTPAPGTPGVPALPAAVLRSRRRLPGPPPVAGALRTAHGTSAGIVAVVHAVRPVCHGHGLGGARKGDAARGARAGARGCAAG